jgi:oligoendopeptidase F
MANAAALMITTLSPHKDVEALMPELKSLPPRNDVAEADTWNLESLYVDDAAWEAAFSEWESRIDQYDRFRDTVGSSPAGLADCLRFDLEMDRAAERLGVYAFLRTTEDTASNDAQRMQGRFHNAASRAAQQASYIRPAIMAIDEATIAAFLDSEELADYRLLLERMLRYRPHTLSDREEKLLAMQSEMASAAGTIFRQLNNADLKFGTIENDKGQEIELSHGSFSACLNSPAREVRKKAFHQYYAQYAAHEQTLAATFNGSIQRDIYYARARGFDSALDQALFPDNVPRSVYQNLIDSVHKNLPALHHYYEVRRRKMGLDAIHHYDTYVPILSEMNTDYPWDEAVEMVLEAVGPLGEEYQLALRSGFQNRWCDRYENKGKQSGAFSCSAFDGHPYILMNYQSDVLNHVFTLAHEAGHAMHSYFSARSQPYQYYDYVIFVAEVASTFNEQLLSHYLLERAKDDRQRAYLINREIDDIRGTILRQTMFAEFEMITHELAESNEPLTSERVQGVYRDLLNQ